MRSALIVNSIEPTSDMGFVFLSFGVRERANLAQLEIAPANLIDAIRILPRGLHTEQANLQLHTVCSCLVISPIDCTWYLLVRKHQQMSYAEVVEIKFVTCSIHRLKRLMPAPNVIVLLTSANGSLQQCHIFSQPRYRINIFIKFTYKENAVQ